MENTNNIIIRQKSESYINFYGGRTKAAKKVLFFKIYASMIKKLIEQRNDNLKEDEILVAGFQKKFFTLKKISEEKYTKDMQDREKPNWFFLKNAAEKIEKMTPDFICFIAKSPCNFLGIKTTSACENCSLIFAYNDLCFKIDNYMNFF